MMKKETKNSLHKFLNARCFRVILLGLSAAIATAIFMWQEKFIYKSITKDMSFDISVAEGFTIFADYIIVYSCIFLVCAAILTTVIMFVDKLMVSKNNKKDH